MTLLKMIFLMLVFKIPWIVFKCVNGMAPLYLSGLLSERVSSRALHSPDQLLLDMSRAHFKTKRGRAFAAAVHQLCNSLPLVFSPTLNNFKSSLKTHLFVLVFCTSRADSTSCSLLHLMYLSPLDIVWLMFLGFFYFYFVWSSVVVGNVLHK